MTNKAGLWRAARIALAMFAALGVGLGALVPLPTAVATVGPSGRDARFGLVADIGTRYVSTTVQPKTLELLAGSGAAWVKEEFRWDWVEPARGRWSWAFMDEAVNEERAKGLEILGLLDYTAGWAVGEGRPVSNTPPPHDLWANYVAQVVGRYKDRVRAWEVWNEPNVPVFWAGTKEQYAALLAVTYDTIKRVDPSATVLGPTISGVDEEWLAAMPWDKIDALALHLYTEPDFLNDRRYRYYDEGLPHLRRVLARYPPKPLWITEFGFSSQGGPDPWHVGDEAAQARYLVQQVAATLAYPELPIARIMPYVFNDHDGFELVRRWATPKPAYHAYRVATEQLAGATGGGRFDAGPGVFAYRFAREGRTVDVAWSPGGGVATIRGAGAAAVYDLYGVRQAAAREGDATRVAVGPDPVYVVHESAGSGGGGDGGFAGAGRFFPETGRTVRGPFLARWQDHGGLAINGYPISGEFTETLEDGKPYTVQYFERVRLELHTDPATGAPLILLGQFGRLIHPADPPVAALPGATFFEQTGHNVPPDFLAFWNANGGLAQFGLPLSEAFRERLEDGKEYEVQYFERARFERHPEHADPQYRVQLGQFGRIICGTRCR